MAQEDQSNKEWRSRNVDLGLLISFVLGLVAVVATVISFQYWMDSRIDDRINRKLNPLRFELTVVSERLERQEERNRQRHQYVSDMLSVIDNRLQDEKNGTSR